MRGVSAAAQDRRTAPQVVVRGRSETRRRPPSRRARPRQREKSVAAAGRFQRAAGAAELGCLRVGGPTRMTPPD